MNGQRQMAASLKEPDKPLKIACVGEAMVELSVPADSQSAQIGFAGDTLNTAIYLKRAAAGRCAVSYITVLGQDEFSEKMLNFVAGEQVDVSTVIRHPSLLPGLYSISKDQQGDRTFSYWRENSAARTLFNSDSGETRFDALQGSDVVYFSAITLAILPQDIVSAFLDWLGAFRQAGGLVAFDSNYREKLWSSKDAAQNTVDRAWRVTDVGLPSWDDEAALFDEDSQEQVIRRLSGYKVPVMILKRGKEGPLWIENGSLKTVDATYPEASEVVDSTAAGDSFNGGFLADYLLNGNVVSAMQSGHDLACKVVGQQGAIIAN